MGHVPRHMIYEAVHRLIVATCARLFRARPRAPGIPITECHCQRALGLGFGRRYAMHHAWRHPSSSISCPSCLLISTIKSTMLTPRIMLGRKTRHLSNPRKVLEARLGNLTLANSMLVDGGTKVGGELGRHQTRTSPETLVQEGVFLKALPQGNFLGHLFLVD